jgi:BirA family transcriptional regulator, biotin operon repressor / biotin---[acetyl-CoA-carboxylase] ligase
MTDDFTSVAPSFPEPFRLMLRETVGSTNDEARSLAESGAPDGLVLLADRQTAGRGRRGAAWFSPVGEALAFSVIVRPSEPKSLWPRLALAAGAAVAEAVESMSLQASIKWPNDVWVRQRKIAGVLVEAGADFAIVGIGINVKTTVFPPEVSDIATSLTIESGREHSRPDVLAAIVRRFAIRRDQIGAGFPELLEAVRVRCALTGNRVSLTTPNGPQTGIVEGIAPGGELLLRTTQGLEKLIQADEVRLLPR